MLVNIDQIKENKALTLTDPNMTRFMMTLEDAVDLVLYAFENAKLIIVFNLIKRLHFVIHWSNACIE